MKKSKKEPVCAITATLDVLGGKWKVFILSQLVQGTRRFGELKRAITGVTQKMLTQQLRELEEAGLVTRKIYPEVPPRVEYALTAHGLTLAPVLKALNEWGHLHRQHLGLETPACRLVGDANRAAEPDDMAVVEAPSRRAPVAARSTIPFSHAELTEAIRAAAI